MQKSLCKFAAFSFLGTALFAATVHAAEQSVDLNVCVSGTTSMLVQNDEMMAWTWDEKGLALSNREDKSLDNMSLHCGGVFAIIAGQKPMQGYCRLMDTDGDYFVMQVERVGDMTGATLKPLSGTGKWKGINGDMQTARLRSGKSVASGTYQNCYHYTGTYTLPN